MKRLLAAVFLSLAALAGPAAAQQTPAIERNVDAGLHSSRAAVAPGERFTIILRETIREGWHTYWRNPGDSGEPTQLTWVAPPGWDVGEIQWPTPEGIPFATLVNHGYEGEVLFPIEVTAPVNARPGTDATFTADAYWLVCSDICVPEEATLTLTVPIAVQGRDDPQWAPRVAAAIAALPRADAGASATITNAGRLSVTLMGATDIRNPRFFPFSRDVVEASEPQHPRVGPAGASFTLSPGVNDDLGRVPLEGVVAFETADGTLRGVEIVAQPGEAIAGTDAQAAAFSDDYALLDLEGAPAQPEAPALSATALFLTLGLALLGGLILNIMPCVLPVLSVKALAFAGGGHAGEARRQGVFYFVGVMATFMALAGLLIALRAGGEAVGWGFQLQAPWVASTLALLFFVIGLNLLGVFEFGAGLQNAGEGLTRRGGDAGAFFTGALAVVAATPCTAPFMAGAIGAALTQPAAVTLLIFAALALGFALPLTLLHFAPALQRLIPKPGAWMERAKQVLAFPMFAAAIWLAWVLAEQAGAVGVQSLLNIAVALAFLLFVVRWGRVWLIVGALVLAGTAVVSWRPIVGMQREGVLVSEPWNAERVATLRAEGRPVFVNFTAAWCITCKANELSSMSSARVAQAFADADVAYLEADWTNRDDAIAAALAEHGRAGVPLYLYYPPGGDVQILPQVLSETLLIETISGEAP